MGSDPARPAPLRMLPLACASFSEVPRVGVLVPVEDGKLSWLKPSIVDNNRMFMTKRG